MQTILYSRVIMNALESEQNHTIFNMSYALKMKQGTKMKQGIEQ